GRTGRVVRQGRARRAAACASAGQQGADRARLRSCRAHLHRQRPPGRQWRRHLHLRPDLPRAGGRPRRLPGRAAHRFHRGHPAAREYATSSYDPNARPTIMGEPEDGRDDIEALVAAADVVKVSDEDLTWLYPERSVEDSLQHWAAAGPALVVLTRGGEGSTAITSSSVEVSVAAPRVDVVDTVGAGDAFLAGLLDGL